ncbi:polymorphic toxin-type HINT domain-containing protein [Streptomyces sp. NBC_01190]|uniref:polymorphic toxin-type HINT domain-containing protein n=1 Tax=Streptomyces sp. NBC_01190 TaxID=2903767 RepID=UPI00386EBBAF|nr:polymorphic toxin-type HINT domain-containing protein [Streptomyces sp. NBC_01190]
MSGVLFTVANAGASAGGVRVGLDYANFAQAYGGNYADRLHLVALPACALTTPQLATCRTQSSLVTRQDTGGKNISAVVTLPAMTAPAAATSSPAHTGTAMVLAIATGSPTGDGGNAGTYGADDLKPSGSWTAGSSNGSFTYNYPITLPGASSSLEPPVALSYDSGSVDGQTSSTQAQASWAGDGWQTNDSYIERTFETCSDSAGSTASPDSTADACYAGDILTLSLNGRSTSLVYDTAAKTFVAADDSGEKVTHFTDSGNGSGTYNTDYWTVADRDGTTYMFGRNELPGWTSGKPTTNSVDHEPVYSAHSGDPCYSAAGFTSSACTMASRWHLDYVVDSHGDAMSYYYTQATNYYGQDNGAKNTAYTRDSYLDHIDYGYRDGGAYGTIPDKVVLKAVPRCVLTTCAALSQTTAATQYPDVPYDLNCAQGVTCTNKGPSFFSTVRLDSIVTEQYLAGAPSNYQPVDTYKLAESEPPTGDGTSPTLWLQSITHTGNDTTAGDPTAPTGAQTVQFEGTDLPNRVDISNFPALYRWRITGITSEMGGDTSITYDTPYPCTPAYVATATPSTNTKSCYPVYWTPKDYTSETLDWFEKYSVKQILETDTTGGAQVKSTNYTYTGGAAWHHDDNEVVKAKYRTYGQFRGYGTVQTLVGDVANDPQTKTVTSYYRGMDDDWLSATSTRNVTLTDSQGGSHTDSDQLAGNALETTVYNGDGGPVDHSTITSYWVSPPVATRTRTGMSALTANFSVPVETFTRQALTDGGTTHWQTTERDDTYDSDDASPTFGLRLRSYTHTVPVNATYDECATTSYAPPNTSRNLVGLVAQEEADSVACGGFTEGSPASVPTGYNTLTVPAAVSRPDRVVSLTQNFYDDFSFATTFPQATAPTAGNITMVRQASDYAGGAFTWQTIQRQTYDSYGRPVDVYDGNSNKTTTGYTVNSVGLTTGQTVKNAKLQQSSVVFATTRGLVTSATDVNNITTTTHYDALGRGTAVWLYSRPTSAPANTLNVYAVSASSWSGTTTSTLNNSLGYATSVTLYDSLGRVRETQAPTAQGGRLITESFFDSRGTVRKKNNAYWDPKNPPALAIVSDQDSKIPSQDVYTYDGLGRVVVDESEKYSVTQETATTVYNGDTTTVIPPDGGVIQATTTDPLGRTTALKEYTSRPTVVTPANTFTGIWYTTGGTASTTNYGYDGHGLQSTVTHAGTTWTTVNNLLGQAVSSTDPDAGSHSYVYDDNGNLAQSTDALGQSISTTYDSLNRKTAQYKATTAEQAPSNELASWIYDNDNAVTNVPDPVGKVTTATSYHGGYAYTTQSLGFNVFGESMGETVTIPSADQGSTLGKAYTFKHTYTTNTGLLYTDVYPAAGGLPAETVLHTYATDLDLPRGLSDTSYGYSDGTTYDAYGRPIQEVLGMGNNEASVNNAFDVHTGALNDQLVTRTTAVPTTFVDEQAYYYDKAGNTTRQTSTRLGSAASAENQCYRYDTLDRLSTAWTTGSVADDCSTAPTSADSSTVGDPLGASSAYWTSWTFTAAGQRDTQDQHATTPGGIDTTTSYAHDGNGDHQPHTLTGDSTTGAAVTSDSYGYDAVGNMTTRDTPAAGDQTLAWDSAGQLTSVTTGTATVSYIYDADGALLLKVDPTSKTLYLPGEEITLNTAVTPNTTTGVRYLPLPGGGTVVRTGTGTNYSFEITDPHGTSDLYLDSTAQTPTWRQFTPYGASRGTTTQWLDDRGFLNQPSDTTTGLTTLGAREYDANTGAFISLDPEFEAGDPEQLNGYDYAGDNPVSHSDPTGLRSECGQNGDSACSSDASPAGGGSADNYHCGDTDSCGTSKPSTGGGTGGGGGGSTGDASQDQDTTWTNAWTPPVKDAQTLLGWFWSGSNGNWGSGESYWDPVHGGLPDNKLHNVCFGRTACSRAYKYLLHHMHDVAGAKAIAATYCLTNHSTCASDAQAQEEVAKAAKDFVQALAMGVEVPGEFGGFNQGGGDAAGPCSFSPETQVLMENGKPEQIKDIKPGDKVEAANPDDGQHVGPRLVTATYLHLDSDLVDVVIREQSGATSTTHTTNKHPFWDDTTHTWVRAGALIPGHTLITSTDQRVRVVAVRHLASPAEGMYNLTVDQLHTYYVLAGTTPVLVHNTGDTCGVPYGNGGAKAPQAASKRNLDGGIYKDRDAAVAKAREKVNENTSSRFREECSPTACHVHVDVYNNRGEVLETWHYQWHR